MKEMELCNENVIENLIRYLEAYGSTEAGISIKLIASMGFGSVTKSKDFVVINRLTLIPTIEEDLYDSVRGFCFKELNLGVGDVLTHRLIVQVRGVTGYIPVLSLTMTCSLPRHEFNSFLEECCSMIANTIVDVVPLEQSMEEMKGFYPPQEFKMNYGKAKDYYVSISDKLKEHIEWQLKKYNLLNRTSSRNFITPIFDCTKDNREKVLSFLFEAHTIDAHPYFCVALSSKSFVTQMISIDAREKEYCMDIDVDRVLKLESKLDTNDEYIKTISLYLYMVDAFSSKMSNLIGYIDYCGNIDIDTVINEVIGFMNDIMSSYYYNGEVPGFEFPINWNGLSKDIGELIAYSRFDNIHFVMQCDAMEDFVGYHIPLQAWNERDGLIEAVHRFTDWIEGVTLNPQYYIDGGFYSIDLYLRGVGFKQVFLCNLIIDSIEDSMSLRKSVINGDLVNIVRVETQRLSGLPRFKKEV